MAAAYNRRDATKEWNLKHVAEGLLVWWWLLGHETMKVSESWLAFTVSLPWLIDEGIISRCAMILLQRSQNIDASELEI